MALGSTRSRLLERSHQRLPANSRRDARRLSRRLRVLPRANEEDVLDWLMDGSTPGNLNSATAGLTAAASDEEPGSTQQDENSEQRPKKNKTVMASAALKAADILRKYRQDSP